MKFIPVLAMLFIYIQVNACPKKNGNIAINVNENIRSDSMKLRITIGTHIFTATLYDNETANAFKTILPITVHMTELNGNEKYFDLVKDLPTNSSNPESISAGDIMLYGSKTLVLFYKSFRTSYSYTKIGHIDNSSGLTTALGNKSVTVTYEIENSK